MQIVHEYSSLIVKRNYTRTVWHKTKGMSGTYSPEMPVFLTLDPIARSDLNTSGTSRDLIELPLKLDKRSWMLSKGFDNLVHGSNMFCKSMYLLKPETLQLISWIHIIFYAYLLSEREFDLWIFEWDYTFHLTVDSPSSCAWAASSRLS